MSPPDLRLMIVAGEPSGDGHAAALANAIRSVMGGANVEFFGSTGPEMRAAGVETIVNSDTLAIMGLLEVAKVLPRFWRAFKQLKRAALDRLPDAVILVDWPEFNLRLAHSLHKRRVKIIYYISPQVWAWRSYRVRKIQRDVDLLLTILPFEAAWFSRHGFSRVTYVGHPLSGEVSPRYGRQEFCRVHELNQSKLLVVLLPGSRKKEVERILPTFLDAVEVMSRLQPATQFVIALAQQTPIEEIDLIINRRRKNLSGVYPRMVVVRGETIEALASADVAGITSGTATLEATLTQTPMVIVYRESPLNWHTLGRLITAEHFGLVNLIAGERVVPELIQKGLNGNALANELIALMEPATNGAMRALLGEIGAKLGPGGASLRAAKAVVSSVQQWKQTS